LKTLPLGIQIRSFRDGFGGASKVCCIAPFPLKEFILVVNYQAKLQAILPPLPAAKCPAQLLLISQWLLHKRAFIKSKDAYVSPSLVTQL
jgi:hypothetical protein